jgi:hypothetical protein
MFLYHTVMCYINYTYVLSFKSLCNISLIIIYLLTINLEDIEHTIFL